VGVHFHLLFQGRLRRGVAALLSCTVWAGASLLSASTAQAQFYTWGGTGSTTATTDYNLGTNWSNPPAGAPPVGNAQAAIFDATGSASIAVTSTVTPYSWTFNANSQSYTVSGSDVNFGSGAFGIFNLANTGQTISISNNIGETTPVAQVRQLGASTLILSGNNTYTGGTLISAGTLQVTNNSSVGSGAVTMDGGTFQADGVSNLTFTNDFNVNTTGGAVDNNGVELTLLGTISNGNGGTGVLQLTDSSGGLGATALIGVNTYTGGTLVTGATLQVINNSSVGTGTVTLDNGLFQAVGGSDLTFTNNF
jgi:autotransporter-associated beta strand protein